MGHAAWFARGAMRHPQPDVSAGSGTQRWFASHTAGSAQSLDEAQLVLQFPSVPQRYGRQSRDDPSGAVWDAVLSPVHRGLGSQCPLAQQLKPSAQSRSDSQRDRHAIASSSHTNLPQE